MPSSEAMIEMGGSSNQMVLGNDPEAADAPVFRAASEVEEKSERPSSISRWNANIQKVLMTPLIPDGPWKLHQNLVFGEHKEIPRYFITCTKFCVYSFYFTRGTHKMIRELDYEHDPTYSWEEFVTYDLHNTALDLFVFFVVGRLWSEGRCGVDSLGFVFPSALGAWFFSAMAEWKWAQHNVSMHQIWCMWPEKLFIFVGCMSFGFLFVAMAHLYCGFKDGIFFGRLIEFGVSFAVFAAPIATSPFFHFHHWFAAWLVGMHLNQKYWWSYTILALCFGIYINGIAGYGRDSLLGCESAYYNSKQQKCGHLKSAVEPIFCFYEELPTGHNMSINVEADTNGTDSGGSNQYLGFGEPEPLDWRNCSAGGGH